jgi:hypothetical protein
MFGNKASTPDLFKNWFQYTHYFLNQRPWLKNTIYIASLMTAAYVAWPIGFSIKGVGVFALTGMISHFAGYVGLGSLNLGLKVYQAYSNIKSYLNPDNIENRNLEQLFDKIFNPKNVYIAKSIHQSLHDSVLSRFENWVSTYSGNRVPTDFSAELDEFVKTLNEIEINGLMPEINYTFQLLERDYINKGLNATSNEYQQLLVTFNLIKQKYHTKYISDEVAPGIKALLNTPANKEFFFKNVLNVIVQNALNGSDPLIVLGISDSNPDKEVICNAFKQIARANRAAIDNTDLDKKYGFNADQCRVARDILLARL